MKEASLTALFERALCPRIRFLEETSGDYHIEVSMADVRTEVCATELVTGFKNGDVKRDLLERCLKAAFLELGKAIVAKHGGH